MSKKLFLLIILGAFSFSLFSQQSVNSQLSSAQLTELELYQKMKTQGTLPSNFQFSNPELIFKPNKKNPTKGNPNDKAAGCGCYEAPDASYTLALSANDDGSTASLAIPFTFQLYGTNYTSLYINNNGNVSFGSSYSTFSSAPFPSSSYVMVAPFWGDVDTRGAGTVSYKITPTAMYINWVGVGYYNSQTDKLNTFQLIITNGLDPVLPAGNNIAFCYEDMQWTTGSASSGVGGFGGTPSTVGVNKGDGTSFIQLGRFDQPGAAYDGGGGLNDGVSWLDNQSLYFNVASSTNIPPIPNFTPNIFNGAGGGACDTLKMCATNDTLIIDGLFLSPEIGETTTVSVNFNGNTGFTLMNNTPGNPASVQIGVVALPSNGGMNTITLTATDNGVPAQTTIVDVNVYVDTANLNAFTPILSGNLDFCDGGNSILDIAPTNLTSYIWSTGAIGTSITVDSTDTYWVTAELNGCFKTVSADVVKHAPVVPLITGDTIVCAGDTTLLNATAGYDTYLWSSSATDILDSVYVSQGTYTVTATDSSSCSGTSAPFTVNLFPASVTIIGDTTYCFGDSVLLDAGPSFDSYLWSNGDTTQTIYVTAGTYTVDVTLGTCNAISNPHTVNVVNVPTPVITGLPSICAGSTVVLDADSIGTGYDSYSWNTMPIQTSQTITVNSADTLIVIATLLGCSDTSTQFIVTENPLPTPTIIGNIFYCSNDSTGTTLTTANSYVSYVWSNADITPTSVVSAGPISVTVTDANGCVGTINTTITSAAPSTSITGVETFCIGSTIVITADPGFSVYSWDSGESSSSINAGHGSHTVTVTDNNGCTATQTLVLSGNPTPTVSFTINPANQSEPNQPVIFTDASTIGSGNMVSWLWNFDVTAISGADPIGASSQGPHTVTYSEQGPLSVTLTVTSDSNCVGTYSEDYLIISDIVIPNVITPNGDGSNDFLTFTNLEFHSGNKLTVLNRWGGKVFETENYKNDWDGGGQSEGTYFYILTVDDLDEPIKGTMTLFK